MYGATEATARMAWLPPDLAEDHPASIGVAVPGGRLRLDESVDDRPGVGELVYSGPNVMLGYATSPADLARGREHGRAAHRRPGPRGRRPVRGGRATQPQRQGLRAADRPRRRRAAAPHRGRPARPCGGHRPSRPRRSSPAVAAAARARALVADRLRRAPARGPGHGARPGAADGHRQDRLRRAAVAGRPRGGAGGPHRRLGARATSSGSSAAPTPRDGDSFVDLGGDSLSYVELATRLVRPLPATACRPAGTPAASPSSSGWPRRARPERARRRWARLDTTVALRALAILFVVASHVDLVALEGGAHLLLALAGFNFARFQLSAPADPRDRLRHGLAGAGPARRARRAVGRRGRGCSSAPTT